MKRLISGFLSVILVLGIFFSIPFTDNPLKILSHAIRVDGITLQLNADEASYSVYDCEISLIGDVEIPEAYDELPITNIEDEAFYDCTGITRVVIPETVETIGQEAFYNCSDLVSVKIPESVTSIGNSAFSRCESLYEITVPSSVTTMGTGVFLGCYSLSKAKILSSEINITQNLFKNCLKLYSVELAEGPTVIGEEAFWACASLKTITIPSSITTIEDSAFSYCEALQSFYIHAGLKNIAGNAFSYCDALTEFVVNTQNQWFSVVDGVLFNEEQDILIAYPGGKTGEYTVPDGVSKISDGAFCGSVGLSGINFPETITQIPYEAFRDCSNLNTVNLPESITLIADNAFYGCEALTEIIIPDSVSKIGQFAFYSCSALDSIILPDELWDFSSDAFNSTGYFNNKSNWDNGVLCIGSHLICAEYNITEYAIGSNVNHIAEGAFSGCANLISVTIPGNVVEISEEAFRACTSLVSVEILDGVKRIKKDAFRICTALEEISIPDSVTYIESGVLDNTAFIENEENYDNGLLYADNHLINVNSAVSDECVVKEGTVAIWPYAFSSVSISSLELPDSLLYIGSSNFTTHDLNYVKISDVLSWCNINFCGYDSNPLEATHFLYVDDELVTELEIPEGVTKIPDYGFSCVNLEKIVIPSTVTEIGKYAFDNATNLKAVELSEGLTHIGEYAFYCCVALEEISLPGTVSYMGKGAFDYCQSLKSIEIPSGIDMIPYEAFYGCEELVNVKLHDGITKIDALAFCHCKKLESIFIPEETEIVYKYTFNFCDSLDDVYFEGSREQWENITIEEYNACLSKARIHYGISATDIEDHWTVASSTPSDCTEDGEVVYSCACNYTKTEEIPTINHNYSVHIVAPECVKKGYSIYTCDMCGHSYKSDYTDMSGHNIEDGFCTNCGKTTYLCIESAHPYAPDTNEEWIINEPGATRITLTFSAESFLEPFVDYVYICDGADNLVGSYTGDELSSAEIVVYCDTVVIRLVTDSETEEYGFSLNNVEVSFEPVCEHINWTVQSILKAATCTEDGLVIEVCECGEQRETVVEELGHSYSDKWTVDKSSTCTQKGSQSRHCIRCSSTTDVQSIPLAEHIYGEWEIECEATCTSTGSKRRKCLNCVRYEYEPIPFLEHKLGEWVIVDEPSCDREGQKVKNCVVCDLIIECESIPETEHSLGEWVIDLNPTCTGEGSQFRECIYCRQTLERQTIPEKGHNPSSWLIDEPATVYAKGSRHKECVDCREVLGTAEIPQLKCSKPTLKTISNTEYGVKITWGKVKGADKYYVYRKTSSGSYSRIGSTTKTYYTDKTAKSGKKYYYIVKAVNEAGGSVSSSSKSIYHLADTTLKTPSSTKRGVVLKWSKVTGAEGYMVYRKTGTGSYSKIATVKGNSKVTYTDKSAKKGKKYTYKVKAYKSKTYSAYSNTKTIKDKY